MAAIYTTAQFHHPEGKGKLFAMINLKDDIVKKVLVPCFTVLYHQFTVTVTLSIAGYQILGYLELMQSRHLLCWLIEYNTNQVSDVGIPTAHNVLKVGN